MAVEFNKAFIARVAAATEADAIDRMDRITLQAHANLVQATPVDLGQARAGWNFGLNRINTEVPERPAEGVLSKPPAPTLGARKIGDTYHLSNFVKHSVYLNEGSSEQAPAKFVERAILAAVKAVG